MVGTCSLRRSKGTPVGTLRYHNVMNGQMTFRGFHSEGVVDIFIYPANDDSRETIVQVAQQISEALK